MARFTSGKSLWTARAWPRVDLFMTIMRTSVRLLAEAGVAAAALVVLAPQRADAQRRPGVGMGFYTTTGLVTGEVEGGNVTSTTALAEAPTVAISGLLTVPLKKAPKRAWVAALRVTPLGLGNGRSCYVTPDITGCQNLRFEERAALLAGGSFDIRTTVLRVMVGPSLHQVEQEGARIGTTVRADLASPRLRGSTPVLFLSRTFLGSQRGEAVGLTTLGLGFRWIRKR